MRVLLIVLVVSVLCSSVPGGEQPPSQAPAQPEGDAGIAAMYPGDAGIGKDPAVVFVENFEAEEVGTVKARWDDTNGDLSLSTDDPPPGSSGRSALLIAHSGGKGTGGQLYRRLKNDSGGFGFEQLFARFYVKFDPQCHPIQHFGTNLGGNNPATKWPMVNAGFPTDGAKSFWSGIEPHGDSWVWDYYTYWPEMRGSPPSGKTWGNSFIRDPNLKIERGKWICVEMMVKMNDVGESNGEQALWIDGKLISHLGKGFPKGTWTFDKFKPGDKGQGLRWPSESLPGGQPFEGFRWRTVKELNLNYVWIYVFITSAPKGHVSKVWFDDVVVATKYIGPLAQKKKTETKPAVHETKAPPAPAKPAIDPGRSP